MLVACAARHGTTHTMRAGCTFSHTHGALGPEHARACGAAGLAGGGAGSAALHIDWAALAALAYGPPPLPPGSAELLSSGSEGDSTSNGASAPVAPGGVEALFAQELLLSHASGRLCRVVRRGEADSSSGHASLAGAVELRELSTSARGTASYLARPGGTGRDGTGRAQRPALNADGAWEDASEDVKCQASSVKRQEDASAAQDRAGPSPLVGQKARRPEGPPAGPSPRDLTVFPLSGPSWRCLNALPALAWRLEGAVAAREAAGRLATCGCAACARRPPPPSCGCNGRRHGSDTQ
jgi:hypothetical protein